MRLSILFIGRFKRYFGYPARAEFIQHHRTAAVVIAYAAFHQEAAPLADRFQQFFAAQIRVVEAGKLGRMTLEMPVKKARLTIPGAKKDDEPKPQEENSDGED